ncbi:Formate dehydrogenase, cytochrome b556(fdo) subunit [Tepidimonas fonticaldi]|uniref:Formate dehydrogenase subunit gamma n=1 Tax=Tepidimonas fonticaldi TaxID=1101373 RepID=A0A1A6DUI3_9BURK|nr:formate dehydrogenase subunit gamma [Tepidimonas fonticaldi]OBS30341.1 formate dehydrogenase subunit gamma [Tepidimonas fonticaldi]TSE35934.1 Formate dehydrogenase, cytochrome b556(fdo) subunit [Tepidimonas fonticaldi]
MSTIPIPAARALARLAALAASLTVAAAALAQQAPAAAPAPAGEPRTLVDAASQPGYATQNNAERAQVQPGNNAPMWRQVGQGVEGVVNFPYREYGVLIQPTVQYPGSAATNAGEAWRQVRNRVILPYGGSLVLIALLAVAIFYFTKGPLKLHAPETGRRIERFTPFERAAHWANAAAFVLLAVSGLVMALGQYVLRPVVGATLFGWLTYALKNVHNFVGPLFAVSLVIIIATFVRDNLPRREDWAWLTRFGGLFGDREVPSHRFNAGEKIVFWGGVFVLGLVVVGSGLVLDKLVPGLEYLRAHMQLAHMIHASAALLMVALFIGHIYMGTVGTEGAYRAMKTGYVDETWAREHHQLWYEDIQAGRIPAERSAPAAQPVAPARATT